MSARVLGCLGALVCGAWNGEAFAQPADPPALRAHRLVVSGGLMWLGGYPIGQARATLRTNATGATPPPFMLFSATSSLDAMVGGEGRVGFTLLSSLTLEGGASFSRPRVVTVIAQDPEAASQTLAGETVEQYVLDAGLVWQLPIRLGRRVRPHVSGGAGYLRQLHEERTLAETGRVYYAGAGLRYWILGGSGTNRSFGLRADARATWKKDGIDFENRTRLSPGATLFAFVGF